MSPDSPISRSMDVRETVEAIVGVVDFFIPFEVVSGVGLIFAMENILESWLSTGHVPMVWIQVYIVFAVGIGAIRYLSADDEDLEDLADDVDEITD